ncbi:MAG: putative glucose-fructose oxidoreductase oxidoreductase protein [Fibrobacteria bacterium]|jgi:glucose-fructose oxidoreductase|nr:putative glucose-fructose oxidoreductase oxidoreductase protein [Fibrobacteria bacterium]
MPKRSNPSSKPVRYAVVGLGHFAQVAVLPGFRHARNARLTALVSDDPVKRRALSRRYGAEKTFGYDEYDACLDEVDAVYIALPNDLHREYAVRALRKGVHVLCEKPLAVTAAECRAMIAAAEKGRARLMTAYRLHFNAANLRAIEALRRGAVGEPRLFSSAFTMQVNSDNIRTDAERGGGSLYDIGVYCINAARFLFGAEPVEVTALSAASSDRRFREVDEMTGAVLRFPGDRLATFTVSFGAQDTGDYLVAGTKGLVKLEHAYEYAQGHVLTVESDGKKKTMRFAKTDQIGAEISYFSDCIRKGRQPEPSGLEGLADVRVVEALYKSAAAGKAVRLPALIKARRPTRAQEIRRPPVRKPKVVKARPATKK